MYQFALAVAFAFIALLGDPASAAPVEPGTPAYDRALKGRVVGPDAKPVAKAQVRCRNIRTPGEGLMEPGTGATETDDQGRFVLYPDAPPAGGRAFDGPAGFDPNDRPQQHGQLVPLNSTYSVEVEVPGDEPYFSYQANHRNTDFVTIRLARPEISRRFRFEAAGGGFLAGEQLASLTLYYHGSKGSETYILPQRYRAGGHVAPGLYSPQLDRIVYQPVTITPDSPAEIIFKLPPPVTYAGRIVDEAGKPIAGAFLIGMNGTGQHSLARLTAEQWDRLAALPANPSLDDPALAPVREMYTFSLVGRSDERGRFELLQKPEAGQTYGLIAFARDRLPVMQRLYDTKPDANHRAALDDLPLFPAALVFLKPAWTPDGHGGPMSNQPSVSPRWEFDPPGPAGQPEWFAKIKTIDGGKRQFQYDHWLTLNERQPVLVPAGGVLLRLRLETPYHDQWAARDSLELLKLKTGTTKDLGDVTFDKSLLVTVRVTDEVGNAIEGAPVRRLDDRNVWSVAHNSDAGGEVKFHVRPRSTGQFGIIDLPGMQNLPAPPANLVLPYQIGDKLDAARPLVMRLTREQIMSLKGVKPGGPV